LLCCLFINYSESCFDLCKNICCCCKKDSCDIVVPSNFSSRINIGLDSFINRANCVFNDLGIEVSDDMNQKIKDRMNNLVNVAFLVESKFLYSRKPQEINFPHIHWNCITKGIDHYKHLCYMLAPLNCILHLDNIIKFFNEELKLNSDEVKTYTDDQILQNIYFFYVFRYYVNMLNSGYSFTLDPGKSDDKTFCNYDRANLLCLITKIDNVTDSLELCCIFLNDYLEKFKHEYKLLHTDLCYEGFILSDKVVNRNLDYSIVEEKLKENVYNEDIIFVDFRSIFIHPNSKLPTQVNVKNIKSYFDVDDKKYILKGLLYFDGVSSKNATDPSNDTFSFVYDKNAPNKDKPYVYCQLNRPMKYYSLKEIEEGMKPNKTSISSYKIHHLIAIAYSKIN
jgi:hypothetical protein